MPRDVLRFALAVAVVSSAACTVIVDGTLAGRGHGDGGSDAGVDAGPRDGGPDSAGACPTACGTRETCNPATHVCDCATGWMGTAGACVDVNECQTAGTCNASALCENLPGSFRCTCLPGTSGDGTTCNLPQILGFDEDATHMSIQRAATQVGATATVVSDQAMFTSMLGGGTAWAAVVVTAINGTMDAATIAAIQTYVSGGGKVICAHWQLGALPDLQTALGISAAGFTGANDVVTDTMTTPDFFAQRNTFTSPLHLHTTLGFTEGAGLVGGIPVATFNGSGDNAIAITTGGRVIVDGFTFSEALISSAPDSDFDGVLDVEELLANELDYLLRPHALLYYDGSEAMPGSLAGLGRVGMTGFRVRTSTDFDRVYDRGDFAIIFVDSSAGYVNASNQTRVSAWTATVGKTLFSYWELDGMMMDTTVLKSALGVTVANPFTTPRRVFADPAAPLDFFTLYDTFPSPLVGTDTVGIDGDEIAPADAATAFVASRFDNATGPGAIVVARGGKSIVNGFVGVEYGMDADGDSVSDMAEMYANELRYLVTRP